MDGWLPWTSLVGFYSCSAEMGTQVQVTGTWDMGYTPQSDDFGVSVFVIDKLTGLLTW